jgi:hypothetical protein
MRPSRMLAAAAVAVGLAVASPAGAGATTGATTGASNGVPEASVGTVALHGASPTTPVWQTAYTSCAGQQAFVRGAVRTFANRPATGCQVVLVEDGWTFELCAGRGAIPAAFQASPLARIEPGASSACTPA